MQIISFTFHWMFLYRSTCFGFKRKKIRGRKIVLSFCRELSLALPPIFLPSPTITSKQSTIHSAILLIFTIGLWQIFMTALKIFLSSLNSTVSIIFFLLPLLVSFNQSDPVVIIIKIHYKQHCHVLSIQPRRHYPAITCWWWYFTMLGKLWCLSRFIKITFFNFCTIMYAFDLINYDAG